MARYGTCCCRSVSNPTNGFSSCTRESNAIGLAFKSLFTAKKSWTTSFPSPNSRLASSFQEPKAGATAGNAWRPTDDGLGLQNPDQLSCDILKTRSSTWNYTQVDLFSALRIGNVTFVPSRPPVGFRTSNNLRPTNLMPTIVIERLLPLSLSNNNVIYYFI